MKLSVLHEDMWCYVVWGDCVRKTDLGYERGWLGREFRIQKWVERICRSRSVFGMELDLLNFCLFSIRLFSTHLFSTHGVPRIIRCAGGTEMNKSC